MVTVFVSPIAIRSANSTSVVVYGDGGTKKSLLLTACPAGVVTEIGPELAPEGTLVEIVVAVAEFTDA
jgi:hypothetical protein